MTATQDIQAPFLEEVAAQLCGIAAAVDIKMMITACLARTGPADTAALVARMRAAAAPDLGFSATRPELLATLVVISDPLAGLDDLTWVGRTFGGIKTTRECRLVLATTSGLLTELLGQDPFLNPIDVLADQLSGHIGRRCLVETVLQVAQTDQQAYVFKVMQ